MSANATLERLVSQMNIEERLGLLEKIRQNSPLSSEPLYVPKEEDEQKVNFEEQYKGLPWFVRLFYYVIGLFTSKPASKVYENGRILMVGKTIEASAPGVFDCQENRLLDGFFLMLIELKDSARFFYNVLDTGINKDRGAFYSVLASLEMEEVHRTLLGECCPSAVLDKNPEIPMSNLRQAVLRTMDETLQSISDCQRGTMYYHARSLGYLKELSCFLFDRLINSFEAAPGGERRCHISAPVRDMLLELDKILFSLRDPPSLSLFESLFVYELETRAGEAGFEMDREMASLLSRAGAALETIRGFTTKIPLTRIIRCATRNTIYSPTQISGGEDWFQVYRGYWKQQAENALTEYFREKKRRDVAGSLEAFFGAIPAPLENAASDANPEGFPLPEAFALSFLRDFHGILIGKINKVMRPILTSGDFAKREDRVGLTEAYGDVIVTAEQVAVLDAKIAPTGEHGKRYLLVKSETEALAVKRRKIQFVQNDVSKEAWDIIVRCGEGMKKMIVLLEGILNKSPDGEPGGLTNFDKLAGRNPSAFTAGIADVIDSLRRALQVLNDVRTMGRP